MAVKLGSDSVGQKVILNDRFFIKVSLLFLETHPAKFHIKSFKASFLIPAAFLNTKSKLNILKHTHIWLLMIKSTQNTPLFANHLK